MPSTGTPPLAARFLLIPKLLYFTLNVLVFSVFTFTAKYFEEEWGLSSHHYGYITGLCALSFAGSLFWTMVADRTGGHKLVLLLATVGYATSFSLLRTAVFLQSPLRTRLIFVSCCYGLANFFASALFPLLDSRIFIMLSSDPKHYSKELFGRQRLFGVLGQSTITLISGVAIDKMGFDAMFLNLFFATLLFSLLVIFSVPGAKDAPSAHDTSRKSGASSRKASLSFSQATWQLLCAPDYTIFLLITLIAGTVRGVAGNYLMRHLEKTMNLSAFDVSFTLQSRLATEIGVFFLGPHLLRSLGVQWLLAIAQLTGLIRVAIYAVLPSYPPWTSLPLAVELLKGINNACLISAGARYVHDLAPPGMEATAQGIYSGVHSYLANAASGFLGGVILYMHRADPRAYRALFAYTSVLSAIGCIIFSVHFFQRSSKVKTVQPTKLYTKVQ